LSKTAKNPVLSALYFGIFIKIRFDSYMKRSSTMARYSKKQRINRWLRYGVYPSFFPVLLAICYDFIITDLNFLNTLHTIGNHFLDIMLVAFAIAVGVLSSATDRERNIDEDEREKLVYSAFVLTLLSIVFYGALYIKQEDFSYTVKYFVFTLFLFVARSDIKLGKKIENSTLDAPKGQTNP